MTRPIYLQGTFLPLTVLVMLLAATFLGGCGGKEEPGEAAAPDDSVESAPANVAPAALSALAFLPDSAQVAVGIPPVNGILAKVKTFSDQHGTPEFNPQLALEQWVDTLGPELGVPAATTLGEIASAKGVDLNASMAAFLDLRPALAAATTAAVAARPAAQAPPGATMGGADADNAIAAAPAPESFDQSDPDPHWVGVVQVSDMDLAKLSVKQVALDSRSIPDEPVDVQMVGGVEITVYDPDRLAYFTAGDFIVFGDKLDLLKEAAVRAEQPASLRYGTTEFPADAKDELVVLAFPGRYMDALNTFVAAMPDGDPATDIARTQLASVQSMFGGAEPNEPAAMTLVWEDSVVRAHTRIDVEKLPGVLAFSGKPTPLRLVPVLPDDTLALLGLRFTDEFKQQALDVILPSVAIAAEGNPGVGLAMSQLNQVIELLGDELTLGITSMEYDFPSIYIMMGLKDMEQARLLLQMFVPSTDVETHREILIRQAAGNMPVAVNYAFARNALLVSNDVEGLKAVIDRLLDGKKSGLMTRIGGDFSADKPYYSVLHVDDAVFTDVVLPVAELSGAATPALARDGKGYTDIIDGVSMTKGMNGKWMYGLISLDIKPAQPKAE